MSSLFNGSMGQSGVDTGDIPASLRFRSAASAYLSRTFGAPTDNKKWTWSGWVKRGALPAAAYNLLSGGSGGSNDASLMLDGNGSLWLYYWTGSYVFSLTAAAFSRDPTSHVHLVVSYDSTQAQTGHSASDSRVRFYLNGVQVSSTGTLPSQNYASNQINAAVGHRLGYTVASSYPFDGYLSRIAFVDGQALTPSSFGYLNTEINEWVSKSQSAVKAVVDAGGTNSFMLDFDDATSLTTLGYDKSSKGNNWTLNNFSLTAGTSYDWMLDVPGNSYATLNPLDIKPTAITLANGNLSASATAVACKLRASQGMSADKWYFEFTATSANNQFGVALISSIYNAYVGGDSASYGYFANDGNKYNNGSATAYGSTYTTNDVIGVAYDASAGKLYFSKNGTWQNSGDPTAGTNPAFSGMSGTFYPAISGAAAGATASELNFGQAPLHASATYHSAAGGYFRYAPPSGYKALCQRNMPDPAILNPEKHFDVRTRTGTGGASTISGIGFPPELIWTKCRNNTWHNTLSDIVRGTTKFLESSTTDAEGTDAQAVTAFNSDGYSLGSFDQVNRSLGSETYVDWLWKAGGAAVTNNAGSISSQVSANVTAGFSIVTYTGNGSAGATVGHGLGKAPGLILNFRRGPTGANHFVFCDKLNGGVTPGNYYLLLSGTGVQTADSLVWNNTAPSSTVFTLGSTGEVNANTNTFVAYCFAEIPGYSKIFSFNTQDAYVDFGFKSKLILLKRTDSTSDWFLWDTTRATYNVISAEVYPNLSSAESSALARLDVTAFGMKVRAASGNNPNVSGATYIGIAFADVPAKYSLAR